MTSVFMGPYPTRFTRAPCALATRNSARSLTAAATSTTSTAIPALKTLYSIRAYGAPAQAIVPVPLPFSAHTTLVAEAAGKAIARCRQPCATMQPAALPSALRTQAMLCRQARTCCTLVSAAIVASLRGVGGSSTHAALLLARRRHGKCRSSQRWSPASLPSSVTRLSSFSPSDASARDASPSLCFHGTGLVERIAGFADRVAGEGVREDMLSRVSSAPASSTSTSASVKLSPLHVSKRHYGSTAAGASSSRDGSGVHEESRRCEAAEDAEGRAVPAFEDVYAALQLLGLVHADGRVLREWATSDVKRAYRALAKQTHPDVAGGSSAEMERINTAYDCLTSLSEEVVENYRVWLEMGGEEEMWVRDGRTMKGLLRWTSRDVVQLVLVGSCTTFSGVAAYAGWSVWCSSTGTVKTAPSGSAKRHADAVRRSGDASGGGGGGGRLTLPRAGATLSSAPGVQYGVVSSGGSLFMPSALSLRCAQLVRSAVSRYALAVALTVAAFANTLMMQRVLQRLITGAA